MTTTTISSAMQEFHVRCLQRAQMDLAKVKHSGFPLPNDVAAGVQELMDRIPALIAMLEASADASTPGQHSGRQAVQQG